MSRIDLDRGRQLLAAIRREIDPGTPHEERPGWSGSDLHELFTAWGFTKQWMFDGYYLRGDPDVAAAAMTVPPAEVLDEEILREAVKLVDTYCQRRGIPIQENI